MMFLEHKVPRSYYLISFVSLAVMEVLIRLSYRIVTALSGTRFLRKSGKHVMVVGAGQSGTVILKEMLTSQYIMELWSVL